MDVNPTLDHNWGDSSWIDFSQGSACLGSGLAHGGQTHHAKSPNSKPEGRPPGAASEGHYLPVSSGGIVPGSGKAPWGQH